MKKKLMIYLCLLSLLPGTASLTPAKPAAETENKMTLAALGDCIITRKFSLQKDPGFLKLVKIIRDADCTWANCEMPIIDSTKAYMEYREEDIPGLHEEWAADELKWLGVDLVGIANNHTMDCGREGLFSTIKHLDRVGIAYAGAGIDLEDAARPRYLETHAGRIGQVNCAGTFHKGTQASLPTLYLKGRPGLNPLEVDNIVQVKKNSFNAVKKMIRDLEFYFGWDERKDKEQEKIKEAKKVLEFLELKLTEGKNFDYLGKAKPKDLKRITDAVKIARSNAHIVIASIHEHRGKEGTAPVKFLEDFARACIDAGADVVFNTGPHRLWGIEIYKNKPIFYSLGNFFFQITSEQFSSEVFAMLGLEPNTRDATAVLEKINQTYFNEDCYWESVVPVITFKNRSQVTGIKLYPVVLGKDKPIFEQGLPLLAEKERGKVIINELAKLSRPYHTEIDYQEGAGVVRLPQKNPGK